MQVDWLCLIFYMVIESGISMPATFQTEEQVPERNSVHWEMKNMHYQAEEKSDYHWVWTLKKTKIFGAASYRHGWLYLLACDHSTLLC